MEKLYESFDKFNDDLQKEYSFADIAILLGDIKQQDIKGYMICCPFHKEKTPSCQIGVHPGHLFYRCYGCGEKGNIYNFVMKNRNVSFVEAVCIVADVVNSEVKFENYNFKERKKKLNQLEVYFNESVKRYEECKDTNILKVGQRFFPFQVGLNRKSDRIVLPFIRNGKVIGFTARTLINVKPKWIHSNQEDSLLKECNNIFNFDNIQKETIIVEGPGDVASFVRAGFENTVCICGSTNFSEQVIREFNKVKSFIFCPDGDEAGRHALKSWVYNLACYNFDVFENSFVVVLPEDGKDPGDLSPDELNKFIAEKIPAKTYLMEVIEKQDIVDLFHYKNKDKFILFKRFIKNHLKNEGMNSNEIYCYINNKPNVDRKMVKKEVNNDYQISLLATCGVVNEDTINAKLLDGVTPQQAEKILKMKYGIIIKDGQIV